MSPSAVLDDLYMRHHTRLTNYIDTLLAADGEEASTEDAVEDTWLRALKDTAVRDWPELRDLADEVIEQLLQAKAAEDLLVDLRPDRMSAAASQPASHHVTRRPAGARPAGPRPAGSRPAGLRPAGTRPASTTGPGRRPLSPSLPHSS
ncbi:bacteriocin immunity protein [Streptomyces albidoflavus]|uniref:bacteriocin immunity protein n=1 Tax=Streptomyces albidoflavus TaxID=1886 RepID=UPI003443CEE9|nr:bacteriocin immunity protein [Streptomyces albidoflavus]WSD57039.1 bacteriocin immunity protein [Streptomyces albidoflavus]WTE00931.1 bacteriocin immunity protein [Streptomyces albidoflavus]